jgi:hypothetical protein
MSPAFTSEAFLILQNKGKKETVQKVKQINENRGKNRNDCLFLLDAAFNSF